VQHQRVVVAPAQEDGHVVDPAAVVEEHEVAGEQVGLGDAPGVPGLRGGRGDLVVTIVVDTPTRLDPRQEELLRELAAIRGEEKPDGKLTPGGSTTFFGRIRDAFNDH